MKGERPEEIVGFARAMRSHAVPMSKRYDRVFDTCGTGGDGAGTFNISTCAALVVAACGVRVAKHGNRAASSLSGSGAARGGGAGGAPAPNPATRAPGSLSGSADVLEALGVRVTAPPVVVERCLD